MNEAQKANEEAKTGFLENDERYKELKAIQPGADGQVTVASLKQLASKILSLRTRMDELPAVDQKTSKARFNASETTTKLKEATGGEEAIAKQVDNTMKDLESLKGEVDELRDQIKQTTDKISTATRNLEGGNRISVGPELGSPQDLPVPTEEVHKQSPRTAKQRGWGFARGRGKAKQIEAADDGETDEIKELKKTLKDLESTLKSKEREIEDGNESLREMNKEMEKFAKEKVEAKKAWRTSFTELDKAFKEWNQALAEQHALAEAAFQEKMSLVEEAKLNQKAVEDEKRSAEETQREAKGGAQRLAARKLQLEGQLERDKEAKEAADQKEEVARREKSKKHSEKEQAKKNYTSAEAALRKARPGQDAKFAAKDTATEEARSASYEHNQKMERQREMELVCSRLRTLKEAMDDQQKANLEEKLKLEAEYNDAVFKQNEGNYIADVAFLFTEALFAPFVRMLIQVFDCSHVTDCSLVMDFTPTTGCFNNMGHILGSILACTAIVALYPAAAVARGFLQLMNQEKSIFIQQRVGGRHSHLFAHTDHIMLDQQPRHP